MAKAILGILAAVVLVGALVFGFLLLIFTPDGTDYVKEGDCLIVVHSDNSLFHKTVETIEHYCKEED